MTSDCSTDLLDSDDDIKKVALRLRVSNVTLTFNSNISNRIKHPQVRATSRSINNAAIIKLGSYERSIQVKQWSKQSEPTVLIVQ